jgi:hypothetical protein
MWALTFCLDGITFPGEPDGMFYCDKMAEMNSGFVRNENPHITVVKCRAELRAAPGQHISGMLIFLADSFAHES